MFSARFGARFVGGWVAQVVHARRRSRANTTQVLADATLGILETEAGDVQHVAALFAQLRVAWDGTIRHPRL